MAAPVSPPDGLAATAATGDHAATLRALRDRLARQIDESDSGRDVAALAARLADVLDKLAALPAERKGTALDELSQRRAAGDGVAARPLRAGRR